MLLQIITSCLHESEDNFQLQRNALCQQSTADLGTLNSCVAAGCQDPKFSGTVGELVDLLGEFVFPSESGVTDLPSPRLITIQDKVLSIGKEFIWISMEYLPCCRVTCTSKRWVNDGVIILSPNSDCTDGFVTNVSLVGRMMLARCFSKIRDNMLY